MPKQLKELEIIPVDANIISFFKQIVTQYASNIAIDAAEASYTYQQVDEWSDSIAQKMILLDSNPLVAIYFEKSPEYIIAALAAMKAGKSFISIDPTYPKDRIDYMLTDTGCELLMASPALSNKLSIPNLKVLTLKGIETIAAPFETIHNKIATIIFTSGSTGNPKPVQMSHQGLLNLFRNQHRYFNVDESIRMLQLSSVSFDAVLPEMFTTLLLGATIVVPDAQFLSAQELEDVIVDANVTTIIIAPSILDTIPCPSRASKGLRTIVSAGEALTQKTIDTWAPNVDTFVNAYGPTEGTVLTSFKCYQPGIAFENNIGRAIDGVTIYLLDDNQQEVSAGEVGEICFSGLNVSPGYFEKPELTEKAFVQNPAKPEEVLYRTGDLGVFGDNGDLFYKGRFDQQVKINGVRIELEEVENQIAAHEEVEYVAVKVVRNEHASTDQLVAFVSSKVLPSEVEVFSATLKQYCLSKLPRSFVPHKLLWVPSFPRLPNGKLDKKSLCVEDYQCSHASSDHGINDEVTNKLTEIYRKVLKLDENHVLSEKDDFFDLGGTSLLALKCLSMIKKVFDLDVSIDTFFEKAQIGQLVEMLGGSTGQAKGQEEQNATQIQEDIHFNFDFLKSDLEKALPPSVNKQNYLLTGANGFLGIHLCVKILECNPKATINALVRGKTVSEVEQKFHDAIQKYHLSDRIPLGNVKLIKGDLGAEFLGLSHHDYTTLVEQVDLIVHCGANVNHLLSYEKLRADNVFSTIELVKFAVSKKQKAIQYVSALDVALLDLEQPTDDGLPQSLADEMGYVQTKWVSEQVLKNAHQQLGLPTQIVRPGNIISDLNVGEMQTDRNHFYMLTKSCIQLGVAPDVPFLFEMMPVDLVANAIGKLGGYISADLQVANLQNDTLITWPAYIQLLTNIGLEIELVSEDSWRERIKSITEENALFPFKQHYLSEGFRLNSTLASVDNSLARSHGIEYPMDYQSMVKRFVNYMVEPA